MKMLVPLTLVLSLAFSVCFADASDDTLKFYLSKSDLVALGKIVSLAAAVFDEAGVPNYLCDFKVSDVLKGDSGLKEKTIRVNIMRFEMSPKDHHPLIKKGSDCILFLKRASGRTIPRWVTADFWFGAQHPSPWMAKSLKRLARKAKVEPTAAPDKK